MKAYTPAPSSLNALTAFATGVASNHLPCRLKAR